MQQQPQMTTNFEPPPAYATDVLNPPLWNGPPGQLIPWLANGSILDKYAIFGADSQVLQINLLPNETVVSQPGAMLYRGTDIGIKTGVGSCGDGCKRLIGGESFFRNTYTNNGQTVESIAVSPAYPAKIIPIDLSRCGTILAKPGGYIAHIGEVHISFQTVGVGAACFGGNGLWLLKLSGTGTVFVNGGGSVMEKILAPGENLLVYHDALVGFSETAKYGIKRTGGCLTCCCGQEGLFNTMITGPGLVMVQSMSKERLAKVFAPKGGRNNGNANNESVNVTV
ncbi:hypothetical protein HDV04_006242 [Boothiomyces sp. JEL0838]|nr:hypothetical protein HDV04_006242 [Boothiomyces sp. JEL0838]